MRIVRRPHDVLAARAVVQLDGDRIVTDGLGSTEMGCDAERHAQDEWLEAFLVARPKLKLEGAKLTLSTDCGMKPLPRMVARMKLKNLAEAAAIVRKEIGAG